MTVRHKLVHLSSHMWCLLAGGLMAHAYHAAKLADGGIFLSCSILAGFFIIIGAFLASRDERAEG